MQSNFSESDDAASAYGMRGKRVTTKMLELRMKDGQGFAIGYHWLQSLSFTPDHHIEIIFTTHEVEIRGRHLKNLYRGLLEHKVPFIQEGDELYEQSPPNEPFVSAIEVERR